MNAHTTGIRNLPGRDGPTECWQLVREAGLGYAPAANRSGTIDLHWPAAATMLSHGRRLIVDELDVNNGVPAQMLCRTLLTGATGEILYDSADNGISDGFGCPAGHERFALLRRTHWDLIILDMSGHRLTRIDLSKVSKHLPRTVNYTWRDTFLVAFDTRNHELDIVEIDLSGRVIWYLPDTESVGIPGSLQLLSNGNILVADEFRHVVTELHRDGSSRTRWGEWADASCDKHRLAGPKHARELDDGTLLIADLRNHRFLEVRTDGHCSQVPVPRNGLMSPSCIDVLDNGNYLLCDGGNRCVTELTRDGKPVWQFGQPVVGERQLSFPRSVEVKGDGTYLVADTANNRVVNIGGNSPATVVTSGLFWPRAARLTDRQSLLVADGRNSRVLELSAGGETLNELRRIRVGQKNLELQDPHDITLLANGNVLVVDSEQDLVFESDWNGKVAWRLGGGDHSPLKDPHSAQRMPDGRIVIADTGNHRVAIFSPADNSLHSLELLEAGNAVYRFHFPRHVSVSTHGTMAIADSGNNRVLVTGTDRDWTAELITVPDSPIPTLQFPRWTQMPGNDELVIADHFHHRIVHLRLTCR